MLSHTKLSHDPFAVVDPSTEALPYEQPEADRELATRVDELLRAAKDYRASYDRNWDFYRRYLKGEPIAIHKATGAFIRLSHEDGKRLRSSKNTLRPTSRSLIGKLTRTIPNVRVVPPGADFEDAHGAQVADALLGNLRKKLQLTLKYQEALECLPWAGNGFLELQWDPQAGEKKAYCELCGYSDEKEMIGEVCPACIAQREQELAAQAASQEMMQEQVAIEAAMSPSIDPMSGEPIIDIPSVPPPPMEQLGPLPIDMDPPPMVEIKTGDVCVKVRDPRDVYPEPGAKDIRSSRWFIVRELLPVSTLRSMFPDFALFIQRETVDTERAEVLDSLSETPELYDNHAYLDRLYEIPSEAYPEGRIICKVGGLIVSEAENPLYNAFGRHSLFHFGWDHNSGEFFFEPYIEQAWHRQRELNNNETAIREHTELLLKPKVLIPLGSRLATDEMSATSAQIMSWNRAAGEPLNWEPPPVPTDLWNRGAQLAADIRELAGITDADVGLSQADPNGRATAIIQAEADQQLSPITRRNNEEFRDLHRCALVLVHRNYHPDRTWTVAGPDGTEVYYFYEMNLSDQTDVELEEHDGLSNNPAVRLQQVSDLAMLGFYGDPKLGGFDKKAFSRAAKLHDPGAGYNMEATERAAAGAIPKMIEQGVPVVPHTFDDPILFAEELLAWLRGPGRRADLMLLMTVEEIWKFYVEWAMTGMMPMTGFPMITTAAGQGGPFDPQQVMAPGLATGAGGGPGPGGPDTSAQGGSANNPGHLASDQMVAGGAQARVSQADQAGEDAARISAQREG